MIQVCNFDSVRDIEQTVPNLSVDVAEVMATHQVFSTGTSTPYNKIDNPSDMGHYCTDKIQTAISAMRLGASMAASSLSSQNNGSSNGQSAE